MEMLKAIQQVNKLTDDEILAEVEKYILTEKDGKVMHEIDTLVEDYCHDRQICKYAKVDYVTLGKHGFKKLLLIAILVVKEK